MNKKIRITEGLYHRTTEHWLKVEWVAGGLVSYNASGRCQTMGGGLQCSVEKFREILKDGGYAKRRKKP